MASTSSVNKQVLFLFNMDSFLRQIIFEYDKDIKIKEKQLEFFTYMYKSKEDVIVNLPVGYGKSILYHLLPKILGIRDNIEKPVVIVLSPLNIIQKDQLETLRQHDITSCRLDIKGHVDNTMDNYQYEMTTDSCEIDQIENGQYSVILCHPEAILNTSYELLNNLEFKNHVVAIAIDECHILETWGAEFRTSFQKLKLLKTFFQGTPVIALSGTLTVKQKSDLPNLLNLNNVKVIELTPDRPNIYLSKIEKSKTNDTLQSYEDIYKGECDRLFTEKEKYPVTLMFLPVFYLSQALVYLQKIFGPHTIEDSLFSALCSGQDQFVINETIKELRKTNPRLRLILTTSIAGMGFDPENVTRIIHATPPRNLSQYIQEIGRAGRRGQESITIII